MFNQYNDDELKNIKLTPTELRKYKGFENLPEHEAEQVINTLMKLSAICYNHLIKQPTQ